MKVRERKSTAERRKQIAYEALRILASRGAAELTAKNLGLAVGISDGAVFKHFPNKEAIVGAAIDRFESILVLPDVPKRTSPLERLRLFFLSRLTQVHSHPEVLELAFGRSLEMAAGPAGSIRVRRVMARSVAYVRRCVREAQREEIVSDGADATVLTWMVHGVIQAAAKRRVGNLSTEQIWNHVSAILTSGGNANK